MESLKLYEGNEELRPLEYSTGKNQLDTVKEILEAFENNDLVFLRGVVGSGKSVVGIKTALELGRGVVSVPTKMLSRQYRDDYSEGGKYFLKESGDKAKISVMQGRNNFICPYANRQNPNAPEWKRSCHSKRLPCTKPLPPRTSRGEVVVNECPWAGIVKPEQGNDKLAERFDLNRKYLGIKDIWNVQLNEGGDGKFCPYWEQYTGFVDSDIVAMNSSKFNIETMIGRLPKTGLVVIDEADLFLDNLSTKVVISDKKIKRIGRKIKKSSEMKKPGEDLKKTWEELASKKLDPIEAVNIMKAILGNLDVDLNFYWQLDKLVRYQNQCSIEDERGNKNRKITFIISNPKPVLSDIVSRLDTKILMMSATVPEKEVLNKIFGIDPVFIEGEPEFPGVVEQNKLFKEVETNHDNWQKKEFREKYSNVRNDILKEAKKPAFVPCHALKYLPDYIDPDKLTDQEMMKKGEVHWSTKADRGADLGEMNSTILLKYPFPSLGDSLLQAMRKKLGDSKFWEYYEDLSRREFIQQIGRTVRSPDDSIEFWSPDKMCHDKLEEEWRGEIIDVSLEE